MLVVVVMRVPPVVILRLRRGGGGRAQDRDQRRGKARGDHALEEGPACVIGGRLTHRLVTHGLLLSAMW